jgi:hypothetical protein
MSAAEEQRAVGLDLEALFPHLDNIPVESIHIAITTHARRQFVRRFPAPQAPKELDDYLRANVRESSFLTYANRGGTARYGNKYWEFILALNTFSSGRVEAVVISCWGTGGLSDFKNKKSKAMVYRRTRENRGWREECLA